VTLERLQMPLWSTTRSRVIVITPNKSMMQITDPFLLSASTQHPKTEKSFKPVNFESFTGVNEEWRMQGAIRINSKKMGNTSLYAGTRIRSFYVDFMYVFGTI
jgi:hypothetical protein